MPRCPFASPAPTLAAAARREAWHAQGWGCFMGMLGSRNANAASPRACPCPSPGTAVRSEHDQHQQGQARIPGRSPSSAAGQQHGFLSWGRLLSSQTCPPHPVPQSRAPTGAQGPTRHPQSPTDQPSPAPCRGHSHPAGRRAPAGAAAPSRGVPSGGNENGTATIRAAPANPPTTSASAPLPSTARPPSRPANWELRVPSQYKPQMPSATPGVLPGASPARLTPGSTPTFEEIIVLIVLAPHLARHRSPAPAGKSSRDFRACPARPGAVPVPRHPLVPRPFPLRTHWRPGLPVTLRCAHLGQVRGAGTGHPPCLLLMGTARPTEPWV